jgi:hypothetical protein
LQIKNVKKCFSFTCPDTALTALYSALTYTNIKETNLDSLTKNIAETYLTGRGLVRSSTPAATDNNSSGRRRRIRKRTGSDWLRGSAASTAGSPSVRPPEADLAARLKEPKIRKRPTPPPPDLSLVLMPVPGCHA